jgi:hypothetical protein
MVKSLGSRIVKFDLSSFRFLFLMTFVISNLSFSQPDYNMSLNNGVRVNLNTIEFDISIKSLNTSFNLTSYQCSFLFNNAVANGGQLSFTYIDGSSQLSNLPTFAIGINSFDGQPKLTFASMAGTDLISNNEVVVGRFRLKNTNAFANVDPNISWSFGGFVSTILTGESFQNITTPVNHTNNLTLGFNSHSSNLPSDYKLLQNYPNPFNPSTTIAFDLPVDGHVNLAVFNVLGQKVENVISDRYDAGSHAIDFASKELSSGTYFCKLEIDDKYVEIIKMVILK